MNNVQIHPTAIIERGVRIGERTSVWDNVHIRRDTVIGSDCIVGEKTHISYDVVIGNLVKINAFVYICNAVTVEDGVMVSAGCVFTNDRYPRATDTRLSALRSSDPGEDTLPTRVQAGATLGAGCIIGCGLTIGRWAMIGMGSLVTKTVPDYALMLGSPARQVGYVCRCGEPLVRFTSGPVIVKKQVACARCGLAYSLRDGRMQDCFADFQVVSVK